MRGNCGQYLKVMNLLTTLSHGSTVSFEIVYSSNVFTGAGGGHGKTVLFGRFVRGYPEDAITGSPIV
jgi:hypothetical protein